MGLVFKGLPAKVCDIFSAQGLGLIESLARKAGYVHDIFQLGHAHKGAHSLRRDAEISVEGVVGYRKVQCSLGQVFDDLADDLAGKLRPLILHGDALVVLAYGEAHRPVALLIGLGYGQGR